MGKQKEKKVSKDEIVHQFMTFFVAGMETTGITTALCLRDISSNSEVQQKALEECKRLNFLSDSETSQTILQANYLGSIFKETLRLHGPAGFLIFDRVTKQNVKYDNIEIEKGVILNEFNYFNTINEKYFENPFAFNPERWMDQTISL